MRSAPFDRSRLPSARTWLVLLVALVLTVTGLPFAIAGDEAPADDTAAATADGAKVTAAPAPEATEDPIVIPLDPPSEAPADDEEEVPATEAPADPAETEAPGDGAVADGDQTVADDEPASAPVATDTQLAPAQDEVNALAVVNEPSLTHNVTPTVIPGNPTCGVLFPNEIKVEPVRSGTFTQTFTQNGETFTASVTVTVPGTPNGDGQTFDFSSATPRVGAVVVKGGPNANLYSYPRGVAADRGLHAPVNATNNSYYGLSHISFCFPPFPEPELELSKKAVDAATAGANTVTTVQPGGTYYYQFTITNPGTGATDPVTLTETLPAEVTANWAGATSSPAGVSCTAATTSCAVGSIPEGGTVLVWLPVTVKAGECGVGMNRASVSDGNLNDTATSPALMVDCRPDLEIIKTAVDAAGAAVATVPPGGSFFYRLVVSNPGNAATQAVTVSDDLPAGLAADSANATASRAGVTCTGTTSISCSVGVLNAGDSVTIDLPVTVDAGVCAVGENTAHASDGTLNDQDTSGPITVTCRPGVSVVKSSSTANAVPGDQYAYTITATNSTTATEAAKGVVVTDDLDDSLTGVSATYSVDGGAAQQCDAIGAGNTIRCAVGTLDIGSSAVVTIQVTATPASCPSVANRAIVTGNNFPNEQSNPVDVMVTCTPALTIDKTASETSVVPGDSWDYTITVASPSTATATSTSVVVTDNLHDGLDVARPTYSVNGGTAQQCDAVAAGNEIRCAVGDLAPGDSVVVTIAATATVASCGDVVNLAFATAANIRDAVGSDPVTVEVVCAPALELDKTASAGTVLAGDDITYTITATNPSGTATAAAESVVITDDLDDDLTNVAGSMTSGGVTKVCPVSAGNVVACDAGDIPIDGSAVVTITATTTTLACGIVTNQSEAVGMNFITETSPRVDVTVLCPPGMAIVKSASAGTVTPGDDYTYTLSATNSAGPNGSDAQDLVITDDLDDDLTGVSATYAIGGGADQPCDATGAGNTVRCAVGDLDKAGSVDVTISATATIAACGVVTNTSTAAGTNFTTITSNSVDVTVDCEPALELAKTGTLGPIAAGEDISYVITASNPAGTATQTAEAVVITDDLDDNLINVTATVRNGATTTSCAVAAGNVVTCDAGDIIVGGFAVIAITATTTELNCGSVTNVSSAVGNNFTTVTSNTVDTTVECAAVFNPAISLVKTGTAPSRAVGDPITYLYEVENTGDTALVDVTLVDDILGDITLEKTSLAIGETTTGTATHEITLDDVDAGQVVNIADVTGTSPQGEKVTDQDTETIRIPQGPSILLEKTPNIEFAEVGDTVTYEYVITNTGNTRLTDITLVDDKIGTIVSVDDMLELAPGESTTVTADYVLTEADAVDADGLEVVNVAQVSGMPPKGPPVTDLDRAIVTIIPRAIFGDLQVVKELDGEGEPAPGARFGFTVDCGVLPIGPGDESFTLGADGGTRAVDLTMPVGTSCTVTETRTAGAKATTVAVNAGAPRIGTSATVTITEGMTTVTFVNTFGTRTICCDDDDPPEDPDLPATGAAAALQLMLGVSALAIGGGLVSRTRPSPRRRRARRAAVQSWSTRL